MKFFIVFDSELHNILRFSQNTSSHINVNVRNIRVDPLKDSTAEQLKHIMEKSY